jgi:ethanolamine permease
VIAVVCFVAMFYYNGTIGEIFVGFLVVGYVYFLATKTQRQFSEENQQLLNEADSQQLPEHS